MIAVALTFAFIVLLFYLGAGAVLCVRIALPPTSFKRFLFNLAILLFWPGVIVLLTYIDTDPS